MMMAPFGPPSVLPTASCVSSTSYAAIRSPEPKTRALTRKRLLALEARSSPRLIRDCAMLLLGDRNVVRRYRGRRSARRPRRAFQRRDESRRVSRKVRRHRSGDREPPARGVAIRCGRRCTRARAPRFDDVDGIAVTAGPGLIGSLVVGVAAAKAYAFALQKPLYAVNHLHGHVFAPFLDRPESPPYPFLTLLVSGGHSQLVAVESPTRMRDPRTHARRCCRRGVRQNGAPARPSLSGRTRSSMRWRSAAIRARSHFRAIAPGGDSLDLSFSGLKTSVRYFLESDAGRDAKPRRRCRIVSSRSRRRVDGASCRRPTSAPRITPWYSRAASPRIRRYKQRFARGRERSAFRHSFRRRNTAPTTPR